VTGGRAADQGGPESEERPVQIADERVHEIFVTRDPARSCIEIHVPETPGELPRVVRLSAEEARRLAALILFQSARLHRPRATWAPRLLEGDRRRAW
jgi:hypothetical protein